MIDQAPRGLLVPGWITAADGRRMAVAVIPEEGGDWAGLTVKAAAARAGVDPQTTKEHLEAGYLPAQKPRAYHYGPRSAKTVAWRQKHLPRELWALSHTEVAEKIGISTSRLHYCITRGLGPREVSRATGPRSKAAVRWVERFAPALKKATVAEIADHYQVSRRTLHGWMRRGVTPKAGGYRTGKRPPTAKKLRQEAAGELSKHPVKAQRNPLAFAMGVG